MNIRTTALLFAAALLAGSGVQAQTSTWTIDSAHSSVNFQIKHLGVSTVRGSLTGVKGSVNMNEKDQTRSSVQATIDAGTVNTGNDGRDKHLKSPDFFDVVKYPAITFKSTGVTTEGGKLKLNGELTLDGATRPISLDLDGPAPPQKGMGGKTVSGFSATGVLKRTDYNFGAKYGPPVLGDEVKFTIDIEMGK